MKKISALLLVSLLLTVVLAGCSGTDKNGFNASRAISVVTREDGSGTRSGFIELFGIEVKNADGAKKDMTSKEAITADKTDVMMANIAGDPYAIGYISLGSLNDTVKAVHIDGVAPTAENVKSGVYKIWRTFNIAVKSEISPLAQDFIGFILSKEGQAVVAARACIPIDENAPAYAGGKPSGKIVVAGSSSVYPLMEKLREAYLVINPNAAIEVQLGDSTSGMTMAMNGTCDIGMASRALKDGELAQLTPIEIALDGIAVIVNPANPTENLTKEQVKDIFTGSALLWSDAA